MAGCIIVIAVISRVCDVSCNLSLPQFAQQNQVRYSTILLSTIELVTSKYMSTTDVV